MTAPNPPDLPTPAAAALQALQALHALCTQLLGRQQAHLDGGSRVAHAREQLLQDADDAREHDAERELDLARTDRDAVALAEVDAALQRLAQGRYGRCAGCGEAIVPARLQAMPAVALCLACATAAERSQPRAATL